MTYWLESLQENAFDVFQVVWIGVAIFATHFLMRWFLQNLKNEIIEEIRRNK
jgi:hypothetical protein